MQRTAVINVVGLTRRMLPDAPAVRSFAARGSVAPIHPVLPAVTCTAQSTYVTGRSPRDHGIVGNGWYDRALSEVQFWKQSNHLVQSPKIWDDLKQTNPSFTCAKLFWWYNMYSSADFSITPRPMYPADGRKVFDIYTHPASLRAEIKKDLGEFPFPCFWGPAAGLKTPQGPPDAVSRWIADSAQWIENRHQPTLNLIYLPHLDYNLQRLGPDDPRTVEDVKAIDKITGDLISFFGGRGVKVILLSEYGITPVNRPIHLNRLFRRLGWIAIKEELGLELLDAGASKVFAVADHQVAHVYLRDSSLASAVRAVLEKEPGVARVLGDPEKRRAGLDHARAGDLVVLADEDAWFTYYYWTDDALAPDFARCVDIHRKPGYDPVELFLDPALRWPMGRIMWRLLQKRLGFRMLLDVIPLDATLVKGSHGICPADAADFPVILTEAPGGTSSNAIPATAVFDIIRQQVLQE